MIPIITYHAIGNGPRPLWVSVKEFESHLHAYRQAGYRTISLLDLVQALENSNLPSNALVITFDDGYEGVYSLAWPRLRDAGFSSTVFLVTDYCGQTNQWPGQGRDVPAAPLMNWAQVREMSEEGCEFGAHTRTHPNLIACDSARVVEELISSRSKIESVTGHSTELFAYPYGETDRRTTALVTQNFRAAVGTRLGIVSRDAARYLLPRVDAYYLSPALIRKMNSVRFRAYLEGRQYLRQVRRLVQA